MERIKGLTRTQKGILVFMLVMVLVFAVVYPITISRVGYPYHGKIFVPEESGGITVYSARLRGKSAQFTVSGGNTVEFRYGDTVYGPYTVTEVPEAVPKDSDTAEHMTGLEIRRGYELIFRGGVLKTSDLYQLYNEDGSLYSSYIAGSGNSGWSGTGNRDVSVEPTARNILELVDGPALSHKGDWGGLLFGALICALNAISIIFEDPLFLWRMSFIVKDPEDAQPSELYNLTRYICWIVLTVTAAVVFIVGLW